MPRYIIEVDAADGVLDALLQPALDSGAISIVTVRYHNDLQPKSSIVDDWANGAREVNQFVARRLGRQHADTRD